MNIETLTVLDVLEREHGILFDDEQLDLPPLLDLHLGVAGDWASTKENLAKAHHALSANSMATMLIAKSLLAGD